MTSPIGLTLDTPAALGAAARAARKQLGLTQPQLALAAGVGVRFIVELGSRQAHAAAGDAAARAACSGRHAVRRRPAEVA